MELFHPGDEAQSEILPGANIPPVPSSIIPAVPNMPFPAVPSHPAPTDHLESHVNKDQPQPRKRAILQPTNATNQHKRGLSSPENASKSSKAKKPKQENAPADAKKPTSVGPKPKKSDRERTAREDAAANSGSESDTPIPSLNPADTAGRRWSEPESRKLLEALFSPDSQYYESFTKDPTRTIKRVRLLSN